MAAYIVLVSTKAFDETPFSLEPSLGSANPCEFELDFAQRYRSGPKHPSRSRCLKERAAHIESRHVIPYAATSGVASKLSGPELLAKLEQNLTRTALARPGSHKGDNRTGMDEAPAISMPMYSC